MSDRTVYLVTGSNRGIGLGLVTALAGRAHAVIFAGARDPAAPSLKELSAKHPNVYPIKLTLGDEADNQAAVEEIRKVAGQLDVIIANAGIGSYYGALATTPLSEFRDFWETNTLGNVILFQAAHKLLLASPSGAPRFALISTLTASMNSYVYFPLGAYASSKAAANFLLKVMDQEHPQLITLAIHPGFVPTDLGKNGARTFGVPLETLDTLEDSVDGILARVDAAKTKDVSGRFWNFKVSHGGMPWNSTTDVIAW